MADKPIIARATPVGVRRLRAVGVDEAPPSGASAGAAAPPGGEARSLTGLNGFLESARRQGAELVAVAREQADAIARNARDQGFAAGYADGMAQAERAAAGLLEHAERTAGEVTLYRERAIAGTERELVELAMGVAEKVLQRTFAADPERVVDVLRGALRKTFTRHGLVVACNPADLGRLQAAGPELAGTLGGLEDLQFLSDRRISPGGVVVRTPAGDIDATLESQLDRLMALLLEER